MVPSLWGFVLSGVLEAVQLWNVLSPGNQYQVGETILAEPLPQGTSSFKTPQSNQITSSLSFIHPTIKLLQTEKRKIMFS